MSVRWAAVPGYEGIYEVSCDGIIRSVDRMTTHGRKRKGVVLSLKTSPSGHINTRLCSGGNHKWVWVHRVVLSAFTCPCPDGMECAHNNGNPADNRLENLRWDTRKGNHADKIKHGSMACGMRNGVSKLSDDDVRKAFAMRESGAILKTIAREIGVTTANVSYILRRSTWRHVEIK